MSTENLYIRQVYGGPSLLDAQKEQLRFTIEQSDKGWEIVLHGIEKSRAQELEIRKQDLNVFHSLEVKGSTVKTWYYPLSFIELTYDETLKQLEICLDGYMQYPAD
jgi:hypothetical protein